MKRGNTLVLGYTLWRNTINDIRVNGNISLLIYLSIYYIHIFIYYIYKFKYYIFIFIYIHLYKFRMIKNKISKQQLQFN